MPQNFSLTIAIASDLHCHVETDKRRKDSFLLAGAPRIPENKHPVQSLLSLIKNRDLTADGILCPGDLSNQICSHGMMQAWDHLQEIERALKCRFLLTTLGNHDVDSLKVHGSDSFKIARTLHPDFPLPQGAQKDSFWARGFYFFTDEHSGADLVVLNSVIKHTDEASAKRGTFEHVNIQDLHDALIHRKREIFDQKMVPHRIAMLHHHPILHSFVDYGSGDVLEYGDQILKVLGEFGYRIIIHGHRHDPRITRVNSYGIDQLVFAAGSFSAYLKELSSVTRNLFHLVDLSTNEIGTPVRGKIRTWEFNYGLGWREATDQSAKLPYEAGFMIPAQGIDFLDALCTRCDESPGGQLRADEIKEFFPQMQVLLPIELIHVQNLLSTRGYKLVMTPTGTIERCGKISPP